MVAVRRHKTTSEKLEKVPLKSEIAELLKTIKKKHGDNTILTGSGIRQPFRIPSGIFLLDYATLGGIPHNRFTMVHGRKHSGKTTTALKMIRGAQISLPDQQSVLVDVEGTYDDVWAGKQGVDTDNILVVQPDTGEQAVDMIVALAHARETSLITIDSIGAMLPMKEGDASAEDPSIPGLQAKLITSMLRKINGALLEEKKRGHYVTILMINQERKKIGAMGPGAQYQVTLPGGDALGFFTSLEMRIKNKENSKVEDNVDVLTYNEHSFEIEKNKMNPGIRSGEYRMLRRADEDLGLNEGDVDDAGTMLVFAKRLGWWEGVPSKGYDLNIVDFEQHFDNADECVRFLYANREVYDSLRIQLIVNAAIEQGMPQDFVDYLQGV